MMDIDPQATMSQETILDNIEELESGWKVAFRAGDARKLKFSYTVESKHGITTTVKGPEGGDWKFEVASGTPKLIYVNSSYESSKGSLDYLEGRNPIE